MHHLLPLFISYFLSLLSLDSFVYKKGESILESIPVCFVISIWLTCTILRGENYTSCTFVGGESHRGDAYTKGEKTFFWENLILLYACFLIALWCFELCLVSSMFCCSHHLYLFSRCFMMLWVMFSIIYALLLSSHHAYVLDMHTSLCYCALLVAYSNDHLLC